MASRQNLTDTTIAKLPIKDKPYEVMDEKIPGFAIRVRPTGTLTFLLIYRNTAGKSQTCTIGQFDPAGKGKKLSAKQARNEAEELRGLIQKRQDPQQERRSKRDAARENQNRTLGAYFKERYKPHHLKKRTEGGAAGAEQILISNFGHFFDTPLSELSVDAVEKWELGMADKNRDKETIKRNRAELESLVNKALKEDKKSKWRWIDENPLAGLKPIKAKPPEDLKPRYLSSEESERLQAALRERDAVVREKAISGNKWRADRGRELKPELPEHYVDHLEVMVTVALKTGLRRQELFLLEWSDIEHNYSAINVRASTTKTRRARIIPLAAPAREALRKWREQSKSNRLVFASNGKPFNNVNKSWKALLRRAEILSFRWHDMRHDFASQLVIRGVSIEKVSKLLGHTDIKTTQRYAHLSNESLAKAVEVLD